MTGIWCPVCKKNFHNDLHINKRMKGILKTY